jgi:thioredoxin-related protein
MKKIILVIVSGIIFIAACTEQAAEKSADKEVCAQAAVQDPNEVKPMALMMRTMANYCDTMRLKINQGQTVDSVKFPLMPFWTAEPTDSSVLEPLFFSNAKRFENAYRKLMQDQSHQKENYTAVIAECTHCHSSFCSGPLKRIRKLPLDYTEQ